MKKSIPISQLEGKISGIRIDRLNDTYMASIIDQISQAHRNDHYICILLKAGKTELQIDFKRTHLEVGTLLFLYPEQVKKVVSFHKSNGWVLFFSEALVNHHSSIALQESIHQGSVLEITKKEEEWFYNAFNLFNLTIQSTEMLSFQQFTVDSLLNAFVYKISSIYAAKTLLEVKKYSSRKVAIARSFRKLLLQNYKSIKTPGEYAAMMNISVGYLNDTVKMVTGENVSKSIHRIAVKEAQRLLYHSTLSIKEISQKVGFDDPQYFSRIFSKISHVSPGEFRKNAVSK